MLEREEQKKFYEKVGSLIRNARRTRDFKQEYLANRLGLTRTAIVSIEQGEQRIPLHTILEVAKLFDLEIKDLIPDIDDYTNISLNKDSEEKLSKNISKFDNPEYTLEILRTFIKYTNQTK